MHRKYNSWAMVFVDNQQPPQQLAGEEEGVASSRSWQSSVGNRAGRASKGTVGQPAAAAARNEK